MCITAAVTGPPPRNYDFETRVSCGSAPVHARLECRRGHRHCIPQAAFRAPRRSRQVWGHEPPFRSPKNSAGVQINSRGKPSSSSNAYTRGRTCALAICRQFCVRRTRPLRMRLDALSWIKAGEAIRSCSFTTLAQTGLVSSELIASTTRPGQAVAERRPTIATGFNPWFQWQIHRVLADLQTARRTCRVEKAKRCSIRGA